MIVSTVGTLSVVLLGDFEIIFCFYRISWPMPMPISLSLLHMHMHAHMHTYTHTNIHMHTHIHAYIHVHTHMYTHTHTHSLSLFLFNFNHALAAFQKEMAQHKGSLKGGAFRLNMHPQSFFDGNPFRMDKPLPPVRKSTSAGPKDLKPFKPSSPGKKVCSLHYPCRARE